MFGFLITHVLGNYFSRFFNEKLTVHAYLENMYDVYFPTNLISCYFCINNCNTNKHILFFIYSWEAE